MSGVAEAVLFVHGAGHGPWCWEKVVPRLEAQGVATACIELYRGSRAADVAAVQAELHRLAAGGQRVVAVGHSLGCTAISGVDPESAAHFVYLAGPLAGRGAPDATDMLQPFFHEAAVFSGATLAFRPDKVRELFYHDCSEADAQRAISLLRSQETYGGDADAERPTWRAAPSTYLVCDEDRSVSPDYQRKAAAHLSRSEHLPTGHSPWYARPDLVAAALGRVLERVREEA